MTGESCCVQKLPHRGDRHKAFEEEDDTTDYTDGETINDDEDEDLDRTEREITSWRQKRGKEKTTTKTAEERTEKSSLRNTERSSALADSESQRNPDTIMRQWRALVWLLNMVYVVLQRTLL